MRLNPGLATARLVAPATPRPAEVIGGALDVSAVAADGRNGLSYTMLVFGTTPLWVTPAPPATTGTLSSDQSWTSQNAAGGYGYVLAFDVGGVNNGIPADLTRSVASGDLATLNHRYASDAARPDAFYFPSPVTATGGPGGIGLPVPIPGTGTVYVNPLPGEAFLQGITQFTWSGPWYQIDDGLRLLAPASTSTVEWGRGPIVPAVPYDTGGWDVWGGWYCPACRTGTSMLVALAPATDTTPGQAVASFLDPTGAPVARFRVWENGTLVSDATDVTGALLTIDGSTTAKTYRILDEVNRVPSGAVQSTSTITDLTFTSAAGAGNALPAGWKCDLGDGCRVLPLLQAAVGLPVDTLGRVPVGSSSIDLTLSHIQGAAAIATSGATVEVRRPGGAWTTLPVTDLGGGRYRAPLTTTSADSGRLIDLRVGGKDAAGGSITQTTVAAFAVA